MVVALVSLVAGALPASAQVTQPCPEPIFQQTYPYATVDQLVPMNLINLTPGTEYLLKVNGQEVKEGVARDRQGRAQVPDAEPWGEAPSGAARRGARE